MSISLDWSAFDASITASTIAFLSTAFANAPRPDFLGEINVTGFSFGDREPEVEILDIGDVWKEFGEVEEEGLDDEQQGEVGSPEERQGGDGRSEAWERERRRYSNSQGQGDGVGDRYYPSNYDDESSLDPSSPPASQILPTFRPTHPRPSSSLFSPGLNPAFHPPPSPLVSTSSFLSPPPPAPHRSRRPPPAPTTRGGEPTPKSSSTPSPSLQIHILVTYSGNLSVSLSTSLLINYPSPLFMSLPLKLSVTSIAFSGVFVIAFEGGKRRLHFCVLDPGSIQQRQDGAKAGGALNIKGAGARLLTGAVVESEVGQSDKHVLKNVGKVEKFVLDVVRNSLENELVFPNFQSIVY